MSSVESAADDALPLAASRSPSSHGMTWSGLCRIGLRPGGVSRLGWQAHSDGRSLTAAVAERSALGMPATIRSDMP